MTKLSGKQSLLAIIINFTIIGLFAFVRILNKEFSSDDFQVVYRVVNEKMFVPAGFFRPLSDLSFYFNYLIGRYNPLVYFIFNFLVHLASSLLLFCFCKRFAALLGIRYYFFAITAALAFLIYPFHLEAIVWAVGRGASMATLFAIWAMYVILGEGSTRTRVVIASLLYFVSMLAYESAMPLPVMLVMLFYMKEKKSGNIGFLIGSVVFVLAGHFFIRRYLSGAILGSYADGIFSLTVVEYFMHLFKAAGRLFLPPMNNSNLFTILAAAGIVGFLFRLILRAKASREYWYRNANIIVTIFLFSSLLITLVFPVSTKTSESDRLLYFPSVFVCLLLGLFFQHFYERNQTMAIVVAAFLFVGSYILLKMNESNWRKASEITRAIIDIPAKSTNTGINYVVNVPGEYKGAYVFRHGFAEALLINSIDTSRLVMVNLFDKEDARMTPTTIIPHKVGTQLSVFPGVEITRDSVLQTGSIRNGDKYFRLNKGDVVWFWDNNVVRPLY